MQLTLILVVRGALLDVLVSSEIASKEIINKEAINKETVNNIHVVLMQMVTVAIGLDINSGLLPAAKVKVRIAAIDALMVVPKAIAQGVPAVVKIPLLDRDRRVLSR